MEVNECLEHHKQWGEDWPKICKVKLPAAKALIRRSFMNTPTYHDLQEELASTSWTSVPDNLRDNLETGFQVSHTLVVENMIKQIRCVETRQQDSKRVSRMRRWVVPMAKKVLTKKFGYPMVDFNKVVVKGPLLKKRSLPKRFFNPSQKPTSLCVKGIVGPSKTPKWSTYNAPSMKMQYSDMAVLKYCLDTDCFNRLHLHWLSLAAPPQTLLRFPSDGVYQWYFSLSNLGVTSVLLMPATLHEVSGQVFLAPPANLTHKDICFKPIFDLDEVKSCSVKRVGPLWKEQNRIPADLPAVLALRVGVETSLKEVAARACFWTLGQTWLSRLASHYKVEVVGSKSTWDLLRALLRHILPDLSEEEYLAILSQRIPPDDDRQKALDGFDLDDVIEAGDVEEVAKAEEKEELQAAVIAPFKQEFQKFHQEVQAKKKKEAAPKEPLPKKAKVAKKGGGGVSPPPHNPMAPLLNALLPVDKAKAFLPGCKPFKLWKDESNGRWLGKEGYSV